MWHNLAVFKTAKEANSLVRSYSKKHKGSKLRVRKGKAPLTSLLTGSVHAVDIWA